MPTSGLVFKNRGNVSLIIAFKGYFNRFWPYIWSIIILSRWFKETYWSLQCFMCQSRLRWPVGNVKVYFLIKNSSFIPKSLFRIVATSQNSVNSVICTENFGRNKHRLVAGNFVEINGPDVIQPQFTTVLPDINGILPLIQLIFAPTVKVRCCETFMAFRRRNSATQSCS